MCNYSIAMKQQTRRVAYGMTSCGRVLIPAFVRADSNVEFSFTIKS